MDYLATNLRFLRKQENMNQTDFAIKLGYSGRDMYKSIEQNKAKPSYDMLLNFSIVLKTNLHDLVFKDLSKGEQEK